jgi:hypothetical protein
VGLEQARLNMLRLNGKLPPLKKPEPKVENALAFRFAREF